MLTKSLNNQNEHAADNDICSPKEPHKTTNDTTSGDEPNFKSSPPLKSSSSKKEAVKGSQEQDLSVQGQASSGANGASEPVSTSKETVTPRLNKIRLKELRWLARKPG